MCWICDAKTPEALNGPSSHSPWAPRRAFLLAAGAAATTLATSPVLAQVDVGGASTLRNLVPAETLERSATRQYAQVLSEARAKGALAPDNHPQLKRLRAMAARLIPYTRQWNPRVAGWRWEVNLIGSQQVNAWCMPGGKIAFYTGILDNLKLSDDEAAMVMGHEMAHALREHARARIAKSQATGIGLRLGAQMLGLGQVGDMAASLGTQLLTLKFSRNDEAEADLVGLEIAARGAYQPEASVNLWKKMMAAKGGKGAPGFLSTHPTGPDRIKQLQANVPKVRTLYTQAKKA